MRIRVIIAETELALREQMRSSMQRQPAIEIVAEFADAPQLCDIEGLKPDVICLGVNMVQATPAKWWLQNFPDVRIIRLFSTVCKQSLNQAIREGVTGYLLHVAIGDEIVPAIFAVMRGEYFSSPLITCAIAASYKSEITTQPLKPTSTEQK